MHLRNVPLPFTVILLIGTALFVGATLKAKERPQIITAFAETVTSNVAYLEVIPVAEWHFTDTVRAAVSELKAMQFIQESIVADPVSEEVVYFSTAAYDDANDEEMLSLYRYNTLSGSYTRLYYASYGQGESQYLHEKAWPVWHVIGYDHEQLIILVKDGDLELSACEQPLLVGLNTPDYAALLTLDLLDPSAGLAAYTPSDALRAEAENAQTACLVTHP